MVLINNKNTLHRCYIPKPVPTIYSNITMILIGETDKKEYRLDLIDEEYNEDYFHFLLNVSNLPDQEYIYKLYEPEAYKVLENPTSIATGLMRIGDYKHKKQTQKTKIEDLL